MSFVLGIYDLWAWLIPGFLYLFIINEFLKLFNLLHITAENMQNGFVWIGLAVTAVFLGFFASAILEQIWFRKHSPGVEVALERVKKRHPDLDLAFRPEEWQTLYTILRQRVGSNNSLEHAERFNAFSMLFKNLVGAFILGLTLQISKLFVQGFDIFQFIFAVLLTILTFSAYKNYIYYWNLCIERAFGHFIAYGSNMETYLANDQPKWILHKRDPVE